MEQREVSDPSAVSDAIVMWTGYGETKWPARDSQRLVDRYGPALGASLLRVIRHLADEFYESDARLVAADLAEMGRAASERFKELHPELTDEALRALAWCYTYDYK